MTGEHEVWWLKIDNHPAHEIHLCQHQDFGVTQHREFQNLGMTHAPSLGVQTPPFLHKIDRITSLRLSTSTTLV